MLTTPTCSQGISPSPSMQNSPWIKFTEVKVTWEALVASRSWYHWRTSQSPDTGHVPALPGQSSPKSAAHGFLPAWILCQALLQASLLILWTNYFNSPRLSHCTFRTGRNFACFPKPSPPVPLWVQKNKIYEPEHLKTSVPSLNFYFFKITWAKSISKNSQITMIKIWDDLLPE